MESIFLLGEDERRASLRHMIHSFGSTYICLWSYSPLPSNCLVFLDGYYHEEKMQQQQPSSSSGSLATSLLNAYCGSLNYINDNNECVPGLAFKNNIPYLEVKVEYFLHHPAMLTSQAQMQFYLEAGIKTAVFMGCATGEIELGFSTQPQVNLQMEIQSWLGLISNQQLIIPAAVTSNSTAQNYLTTTAFTSYRAAAAAATHHHNPNSLFRRSLSFFRNLNMTMTLTRRTTLHLHDHQNIRANLKHDPQMQHVIAERRRRHKQNQSFQILRTALLPQLFKKDKASVLSGTVKYLSSLRSEMEELKRRNAILEMQQLQMALPVSTDERVSVEITSPSPSTTIRSDQSRMLDLRISLRSSGDHECSSLPELVARILGFLKRHTNHVSLLSLQSNTTIPVEYSTPLHGLVLRLMLIQGDEEFDETGFREAVRRVVAELI